MNDLIWINGETLPFSEVRVGVEDRGFQFADGVYEVIRIYGGRPFTLAEHLDRLARSAAGIELRPPIGQGELAAEIGKLVSRAGVADGMVYLQLTRGTAPRNHVFPAEVKPTLLFYTRPLPAPCVPGEQDGVKLLSVADERWKRCWVKSIALLPNVLAKNRAVAGGADEAVFIDEGIVTECSASNVFVILAGTLVTHPVGTKVLPGITRQLLLDLAPALGIRVDERPITQEEASRADEVFITSTTREVNWAAEWDSRAVGSGRCGPLTLTIARALRDRIVRETHDARHAHQ